MKIILTEEEVDNILDCMSTIERKSDNILQYLHQARYIAIREEPMDEDEFEFKVKLAEEIEDLLLILVDYCVTLEKRAVLLQKEVDKLTPAGLSQYQGFELRELFNAYRACLCSFSSWFDRPLKKLMESGNY